MNEVISYIESLSPFYQSLLGSAVFAILLVILRILRNVANKGRKSIFREVSRQAVLKHIIHRDFVSSDDLFRFTWGRLFVLSQAAKFFIRALAVIVFVFGVTAMLAGSWLQFAGFYVGLNFLLEADSWLKDWSGDAQVGVYDEEVKKELLARFPKKTKLQVTDEQSR